MLRGKYKHNGSNGTDLGTRKMQKWRDKVSTDRQKTEIHVAKQE